MTRPLYHDNASTQETNTVIDASRGVTHGDGMSPTTQTQPLTLMQILKSLPADDLVRMVNSHKAMLDALKGVVRVADRKTDEFDAARAAIAMAEGKRQ